MSSPPRKRCKYESVHDPLSATLALSATAAVHKLSDDDLLHIFSFLGFLDRARAAQVCQPWKSLIYQKSMWKGCSEFIKETADMPTMAESLLERGITNVSMGEVWPPGEIYTLLELQKQLWDLFNIMANSITSLNLSIKYKPLYYKYMGHQQRRYLFNMRMPNLQSLYLGKNFQICSGEITNISGFTSLEHLVIQDCKVINDGLRNWAGFPNRLCSLAVINNEHLSDHGVYTISTVFPVLRDLSLSFTHITDAGIAHLANMKQLRTLNLEGCHHVSGDCIDLLSDAGSKIDNLTLSLCADTIMHIIGRSKLVLKQLKVVSECESSDKGLNGLLQQGHRHYEKLELVGASDISSVGMRKFAKGLDNLVCLIIDGENKTNCAKKDSSHKEVTKGKGKGKGKKLFKEGIRSPSRS